MLINTHSALLLDLFWTPIQFNLILTKKTLKNYQRKSYDSSTTCSLVDGTIRLNNTKEENIWNNMSQISHSTKNIGCILLEFSYFFTLINNFRNVQIYFVTPNNTHQKETRIKFYHLFCELCILLLLRLSPQISNVFNVEFLCKEHHWRISKSSLYILDFQIAFFSNLILLLHFRKQLQHHLYDGQGKGMEQNMSQWQLPRIHSEVIRSWAPTMMVVVTCIQYSSMLWQIHCNKNWWFRLDSWLLFLQMPPNTKGKRYRLQAFPISSIESRALGENFFVKDSLLSEGMKTYENNIWEFSIGKVFEEHIIEMEVTMIQNIVSIVWWIWSVDFVTKCHKLWNQIFHLFNNCFKLVTTTSHHIETQIHILFHEINSITRF